MNTTKTQRHLLLQKQEPKKKIPHILTNALQEPQTHNDPPQNLRASEDRI